MNVLKLQFCGVESQILLRVPVISFLVTPSPTPALSFQINTNGFVATAEPTSESTYLGKMPPSFGMIAALQGDYDNSDDAGEVFYRQDSSPEVLSRAADTINTAFPLDPEVNPTNAVVVTWSNMAVRGPQSRGDYIQKSVRKLFQRLICHLSSLRFINKM